MYQISLDVKKGLAQRSNETEDSQDREIPDESLVDEKAEGLPKNSSPEEKKTGSEIREDGEKL